MNFLAEDGFVVKGINGSSRTPCCCEYSSHHCEGNQFDSASIDTFDGIIGLNGNAVRCSVIGNVINDAGGNNGIRVAGTTASDIIISM